MISNTEQQQDSYTNSCLYFRDERTEDESMCAPLYMAVLLNDQPYRLYCMKCEIVNIDITINYNCTADYDCVFLWFPNNTMFERFFKQHRDKIKDRFPKNLTILPQPALFITVQNYSITEVTNDYIDSTIDIDLSNLTVVLTFIERIQDVAPLTIKNDSFSIRFQSLAIQIKCQDDTLRVAIYTIYRDTFNSTPLKIGDCEQFSSTEQITTMTTTKFIRTTTTSSTTFKTKTATLNSRNIPSVSVPPKSNKAAANNKTSTVSRKKSENNGKITSLPINATKPSTTQITNIGFTATTSTPLFTTVSPTTISILFPSTVVSSTTTSTASSTTMETTFTSTVVSFTTTSIPLPTTESSTTMMETTFTSTVISFTTTFTPFTLTTTSTFTARSSTDMETTSPSTGTLSTPFTSTIATTTTLKLRTELFETTATTTITTVIEMTTDKSFTSTHASTIQKLQSSTFIITDSILATTEMTKTMQKTSSTTSIRTKVVSEIILSPIMTKTTSVAIPRSSTVPVTTEKQAMSSSTSTKPSHKSSSTIVYTVFSLLLIITVMIIVLIFYLHYRYRKRRHLDGEDLNTISNMTSIDTDNNTNTDINRLNSSSNVSPSLLSKPYNETVSPKIDFDHMFKDATF